MSQDLFEEIKSKLFGVTGDEEVDMPPPHLVPEHTGINPTNNEMSMEEDLEAPEGEHGEYLSDDSDAISATPISYKYQGSSTIHQFNQVGMKPEGMKRKVNRNKRTNRGEGHRVHKIYYAFPESYCLPGTTTIHPMDNMLELKRRYKEMTEPLRHAEPQPLTMEERKKGYIEETRVRDSNGHQDKFYYHPRADQRFRSLKEVHEFILHGKLQKRKSSESRCTYPGGKYLDPQIIGTFDFKTKSIGPPEEAIKASTKDEGPELVEFEPISEQMEDPYEGVAGSSSKKIEEEEKYSNKNRTTRTLRKGFYMNFEFLA